MTTKTTKTTRNTKKIATKNLAKNATTKAKIINLVNDILLKTEGTLNDLLSNAKRRLR